MASLKFTKMEGIGNDYVYIDSTRNDIRLTPEQIQKYPIVISELEATESFLFEIQNKAIL